MLYLFRIEGQKYYHSGLKIPDSPYFSEVDFSLLYFCWFTEKRSNLTTTEQTCEDKVVDTGAKVCATLL
jgi:hypothetical protein